MLNQGEAGEDMPTFIDESGDAGPGPKCARYFRLGAVYFEKTDHLPDFTDRIALLRSDLNLPRVFEFHFAKISPDLRIAFLNAVSDQPFRFVVSSVEKQRSEVQKLTKDIIRAAAIDGIIDHLGASYRTTKAGSTFTGRFGERVVYDECDDPTYTKILQSKLRALRCEAQQNLVKAVRPGKSKSDSCIQLADMICGAVGRHLQGDPAYYNLIEKKTIAIVTID